MPTRDVLAYLLFLFEIDPNDAAYLNQAPSIWECDPTLRGMYLMRARDVLQAAQDHPAPQ